MNSTFVVLGSAACIFSGALLGLGLQRLLQCHHLSKETQDVVKLSAGMIATLTALVLGLLVSSAKNSFDTVNNGIVQASAKFILLDRALARYGAETDPAREQLKRGLASSIDMIWPAKKSAVPALIAFERANGLELVQDRFRELTPPTDSQRQSLAQALQIVGEIGQVRWLLIRAGEEPAPAPTHPHPGLLAQSSLRQ